MYLNCASYNVRVAKILGVCSAAFLTCLNNELLYQQRQLDPSKRNDILSMTRSEIYETAGLDDVKQVEVEAALTACGIICVKPFKNVQNKNYYSIDFAQLEKIITAVKPEDVLASATAKQFIKPPSVKPMSKHQMHIASLKKRLKHDDQIILQYLYDWVDSVYANPKGFLSISSVDIAVQELKAYADGDQEKQIGVLKIAIKGGLRDLTWAIQQYESKQNTNTTNNFVSYSDIKSNGNNIIDEAF